MLTSSIHERDGWYYGVIHGYLLGDITVGPWPDRPTAERRTAHHLNIYRLLQPNAETQLELPWKENTA